jgi:hypothetical protein
MGFVLFAKIIFTFDALSLTIFLAVFRKLITIPETKLNSHTIF